MEAAKFVPGDKNTPLQVGLVLRFGVEESSAMGRITHVFSNCIYVIQVSTPAMARYAKRPTEKSLAETVKLLTSDTWQIGRLSVPADFLLDNEESEDAFNLIHPLLSVFEDRHALSRTMFTAHIRQRAEALGVSDVTLRRLIQRYYYFGRLKGSLQPLKPGAAYAESSTYGKANSEGHTSKRRGRQPVEAIKLGKNDFVVSSDDIDDMIACLEKLAKDGHVSRVKAHSDYFADYFAKRHPQRYALCMGGKSPLPVTLKQFRIYTSRHMGYSRDIAKNAGAEKLIKKGSTLAIGPGEYYEIDATGGRIHLVDSEDPLLILKTPLIYLIIDRWSRMIVSIYVTLQPASFEEIRLALLIAFTARERRFKNLGVNVDEARWPRGRICAHLVMDRGSEMISQAMLEAAVDGLRIEPEILPPLCPDGKGIVERAIRALKARMTNRKLNGGFADRPLDPKSKRVFRAAKDAAAMSLQEVYWELIDIVDSHNNSSHSHLESMTILKRAGVRPTPRDAYLWGLENITGLESPPLTDDDYIRLLMSRDKATIANGVINYRNRQYNPINAAAMRQAQQSTSRRTSVDIKIDRSDPVEIYVPLRGQEWPRWCVDSAGLQQWQGITMDEEEELSEQHNLVKAMARTDTFIEQQKKSRDRKGNNSAPKAAKPTPNAEASGKRRKAESNNIKGAILGKEPPASTQPKAKPAKHNTSAERNTSGIDVEQQERLATIARMNQE